MDVPIYTIAEAWTRAGWAVSAIQAAIKDFHGSWPAARSQFAGRLGQRAELALVDQLLGSDLCPCLRSMERLLQAIAVNLRRRCIDDALEDMVRVARCLNDFEGIFLRFDDNWTTLTGQVEDVADRLKGKDTPVGERLMGCVEALDDHLREVDSGLTPLRSNIRSLMAELERYYNALRLVIGSEMGFDALGVTAVTNWSFVDNLDGQAPRYRRPTDKRVRVRGEPSADGVASQSASWVVTATVRGGQGRLIQTSAGTDILLVGDPEGDYERDLELRGFRLVNADDPLHRESVVAIRRDKR
jgi:hypothetical protein